MLVPSENGKRNSHSLIWKNELRLLSKEIKDSTLGALARKRVSVFLQTTLFHRKKDLFALQESGSINLLNTNPKRYSNSKGQEKCVQIIRSYSTPHTFPFISHSNALSQEWHQSQPHMDANKSYSCPSQAWVTGPIVSYRLKAGW